MRELIPEQSNLALTFEKLPLKGLLTRLYSTLLTPSFTQAMQNPEDEAAADQMNMEMMMMAGELQQMIMSSGTTVKIHDSNYRSSKLEMDADGAFTVDPQALFSVVGGLVAELKGLDWLIQTAQQQMSSADPETQEMAMGIMGTLGALQAFGKPVTDEARGPLHRYDVKVTAAGELTVNDIPLFGAPQQ